MNNPIPVPFRTNAAAAVKDAKLRAAMRHATRTAVIKRTESFAGGLDFEELRSAASEIREAALEQLDVNVARFSENATKNGAVVHHATDAEAACRIIGEILASHHASLVVKSKSMITEEIHLNPFLERHGIEVVETDLGEFIVQLAGEPPSHITAPAIHKSRFDVGKLFAEKLGIPYTDDIRSLTDAARKVLRENFLSASAGISGANFAVAESGSLVLFTNEGNGRMVTMVPRLHIAVLSKEKILPTMADLPVFMRLLARSATGQAITSYFSLISGPRRSDEIAGADERHIVILDNGRSEILAGEFRDILKCIRCGACMNTCPVFQTIGGHPYGSVYPGPMGIVLSTLLSGMARFHPILDSSTLCGACAEVCPVKVPLVRLIRRLRELRNEQQWTSPTERAAMQAYGFAVQRPRLFSAVERIARVASRFVGPFLPTRTQRKHNHELGVVESPSLLPEDDRQARPGPRSMDAGPTGCRPIPTQGPMRPDDRMSVFMKNAEKAGARVNAVDGIVAQQKAVAGVIDGEGRIFCARRTETEKLLDLPEDRCIDDPRSADIAVEEVVGAIAETGSIIGSTAGGASLNAGLLASRHVALVPKDKIYATLEDFFRALGSNPPSCVTLITGPSRTADIEKTLTIGVHGPGEVIIVILAG